MTRLTAAIRKDCPDSPPPPHAYSKPIPRDDEIVVRKGKPHARFADGVRIVLAPLTRKGDRIRLLSKKWYRDANDVLQCVPLSTDRTAAG
jgi:hypothetical protein